MSAANLIIHAWNTSSMNERTAFIELVIAKSKMTVPSGYAFIKDMVIDRVTKIDLPNTNVAAPQK